MATSIITMPIYNTNANYTPSDIVTGQELKVNRYGNVVTINGYMVATLDGSSNAQELGTVAEGYRPNSTIRVNASISNSNAYSIGIGSAYLFVETTGKIKILTTENGSKGIRFSCSYIV